MTKEEMSFFYDTISKMTDEEIKETLKNLNRIKEKDLDIGVRLLRLISTSEGRFKLVEKLSDDDCLPNGCIGAIDVAIFLTHPSTIAELTYVVANNIKGRDLYCLWNDCAHRNFNKFIINIWALQSGVYTDWSGCYPCLQGGCDSSGRWSGNPSWV